MVTRQLSRVSNNCVVVALSKISGRHNSEITQMLDDLGCSRLGASPVQITFALDRLGYNWSVRGTRDAREKTPRELSNEMWSGIWLVFTRGHVMPLLNGRVTNFNGCGNELITFLMELSRANCE